MTMRTIFYELDRVTWGTDSATYRANPLIRIDTCLMPCLRCTACGSEQLRFINQYFSISQRTKERLSDLPTLATPEWQELADWVRRENGLPADFALYPGATIGLPIYELFAIAAHDILWPLREVVVTRRLLDLLNEAGITGFKPVTAELRWKASLQARSLQLPELYTLEITGRGWNVESNAEIRCKDCGLVNKHLGRGGIDVHRWDGSDLFYTDGAGVKISVTERVKQLLESNRINNWYTIPVDELPVDLYEYLDFKMARSIARHEEYLAQKRKEKQKKSKLK